MKRSEQINKAISIREAQEVENQLLKQNHCQVLGFLKHEQRLYQSEITINLSENSELIFVKEGEVLSMQVLQFNSSQKYIDHNTILNISPNFEQLKRLFWVGQTNKKGQKIGKWNAFWRGENLNVGGCYYDNGEKYGKWIELFENYWDKAQVTYQGYYENNKKQGYWKILSSDTEIGGGEYEDGEKTGYWVDIYENYSRLAILFISFSWCKVTERGKYKNGKKIKEWIQIYQNKIVGAGTYNDDYVKAGQWSDLHENFYDWCQVTHEGKYQNGIKKGQWKTIFEQKTLAQVNYKEGGIKDGDWCEIYNNFSINNQTKYICKYKDGKPCKQLHIIDKIHTIGGGTFNENGMKNWKWIEIHENYQDYGKVTYEGIYNNERKEGKWRTYYNYFLIGGGCYQFGLKFGNWIDLHEHFQDSCQVSFKGEYKNGKKIKRWDTLYKQEIIGGGQYDENEYKIGRWITLDENFGSLCQVTWNGQYSKGIKFGKWEIYFKNQIIGGGIYDYKGTKQGQWIELHSQFWDQQCIRFSGEYFDGRKQGFWETLQQNKRIGGGKYDLDGMKQGKWIQLHQKFLKNNLFFIGDYVDSRKCGKWDALLDQKLIGCGLYDDNGFKIGNWIDLHEPYMNTCISYLGKYNNGRKEGEWKTFIQYQQIGGGHYDENGQKSGKWIELDGNYNQNILTREAEYQNGIKQ
ncbi:unnamed protein product (macronuclear) [Paramecium tetraurelia]|uniref:MORN repeat protein n=1 Tax=Paramecium tetraurelia TaxID=5888 RepID=A0DI74_PARTE|nr:uncharacterized protein GSPATT00017112001 [Paramecium tetraurelia]CAK82741.1 unnamed protein product [Paramecium tetraurelia]|eukprot:XP_001450138.1 hypothetical protein (macronuclear) [Paramecium tetraurelia strain d4-2]